MMRRYLSGISRMIDEFRQFDWSELRDQSGSGRWPASVHAVLCVGLTVLLLLVAEWGWLADMRDGARSSEQQALNMDAQLVSANRDLQVLQVSELSQRRSQLLMHNLYMHSSPPLSLTLLLDILGGLAVSSGLTINALAPGAVSSDTDLDIYRVELGASGTMTAIATFVRSLGRLPVLVYVSDLRINSERSDVFADEDLLTVGLTLVVAGSRSGLLPLAAFTDVGYESVSASGDASGGHLMSVDESGVRDSELEQVGLFETAQRRVVLFRNQQGDIQRQVTVTGKNRESL